MITNNKDSAAIVFMGNSIIEGWKWSDPDFFSNPKWINRGIGGQTTPQMLARFENDVLEIKPAAVLILAGTNDIAGNSGEISLTEIRDNIAEMARMAADNKIQVIVCSVLPARDYPWSVGRSPDVRIPKLNAMIEALAQEKNLYYLDYFKAMSDDRNGLPKDLAEDGVHPTPKGYAVMKGLTLDALKELNLLP